MPEQTTAEPTEKDRQWAVVFLGMLDLPETQEAAGINILSKMLAWARAEGRREQEIHAVKR